MQTRRLIIKENTRPHPVRVVGPDDFVCEPGLAIEPEQVLTDPEFSLYCLNPDRQTALFVETPPAVDLLRAPFYYQAQVEHAVSLVEMPMETFHRVVEKVDMPSKGLVFVHSVGRCGSTLVSKVLEAAPKVHSLSEPDVLTQLVILREWDGSNDPWVASSISSAVAWYCKPRKGPTAEMVAIKTRSEVVEVAELMCSAYPDAKNLFLYRDAFSWLRSVFRMGPANRPYYDEEMNRQMEEGFAKMNPLVAQCRTPEKPLHPMQIWSLNWIAGTEKYRTLQMSSYCFAAMRFADIISHPDWMVDELSRFCGIEISDRAALELALSKDSQEGTVFSRKTIEEKNHSLPDVLRDECVELIRSWGGIPGPELVLPGTLLPP